jgi:hypothetical protein
VENPAVNDGDGKRFKWPRSKILEMSPCRRMFRYVFQVCIVGKVFKPNRLKVLALNKTLNEYSRLVQWYIGFNSKSKSFLHENCYVKVKELFDLNTALIQTAGDKAVEILKRFERNRKEESVLRLKRISTRFDGRCYEFSKRTNVLTPYWLTLSLNKRERISLPIVFGERQEPRASRPMGRLMEVLRSGGGINSFTSLV